MFFVSEPRIPPVSPMPSDCAMIHLGFSITTQRYAPILQQITASTNGYWLKQSSIIAQ